MGCDQQTTTLGAICKQQGGTIQTGPFGSQLHASDYSDRGTPVVMPLNLVNGVVETSGIARVASEHVERLSRHCLVPGDIVFSRRGDVTRFALITERERGWLCGTGCLKVSTGEPTLATANFIAAALASPGSKEWLIRHAVGATMPNLNTGILGRLPISLPPLSIQEEVTQILGALNDRLQILRQTNTTLEAIAQALFKSWFVDFDPVHAKSEGRAPEAMDAATAALFPSEFEESELGLIPKGWHVDEIGNAVKCLGGGTPSTKEDAYWTDGEFHWVTPKDLSGLQAPVLTTTDRKITSAGLSRISSGLLPIGTLLMSSRAPIGYLALTSIPTAINQGFIAMPPGGTLPPLYLFFWARINMDLIKQSANGSTFMEISKKAFRPIKLCTPPPELVDAFVAIASPLVERIKANGHHRVTLAELRDTLLPRLIYGKLRLLEIAEAAEAALA